jgi:hypothetical protein
MRLRNTNDRLRLLFFVIFAAGVLALVWFLR